MRGDNAVSATMAIAIAAQRTRIDASFVAQSVTVERTAIGRDVRQFGENSPVRVSRIIYNIYLAYAIYKKHEGQHRISL